MALASSVNRSGIQAFARYRNVKAGFAQSIVTGGALYSDSTYYYRVFLGNGTLSVSSSSVSADVLVIAGGGGGGNGADQADNGGGGGAGGLLYQTLSLATGSYAITVGAGGAGGSGNGSTSSINALLTAVGGGKGANINSTGSAGGSGGGGSSFTYAGGAGTSGQGYAGGSGARTGFNGGGGGGGAAAAGSSGATAAGGSGSSAYSSWGLVTGTGHNVSGTVYYAGGGSGGNDVQLVNGANGGGGYGQVYTASSGGGAGFTNTGGGGGGGASRPANVAGGAGGSGIVIVRYPKSAVLENGFVPTSLSGLTVWYDLQDSSSVTLTSGQVSAVADKSGNDRHLTSYSAGTRPGYASKQGLTFNGTQYMYNDMGYTMPITRTMFAVVTLYQLDPPASSAGSGLMGFEYLSSDNFDTVGYNENSARKWQFESSGGSHNVVGTTNETLINTRVLISSVQGSNDFRLYRNGVLYLSGSMTAFSTETRFILGQRHNTQAGGASNGFWYGTVSEVMAYNSALSDTNRTTVETYLKNKWGTP